MTVFAGGLRTNQMESHKGSRTRRNLLGSRGRPRFGAPPAARLNSCLCKDPSPRQHDRANLISSIPLAAIKLRIAEVDVAFRQSIFEWLFRGEEG
jgi:hypothetical protein